MLSLTVRQSTNFVLKQFSPVEFFNVLNFLSRKFPDKFKVLQDEVSFSLVDLEEILSGYEAKENLSAEEELVEGMLYFLLKELKSSSMEVTLDDFTGGN